MSVKCLHQAENGVIGIQGREKSRAQKHETLTSSEAQKTDNWLNLRILLGRVGRFEPRVRLESALYANLKTKKVQGIR